MNKFIKIFLFIILLFQYTVVFCIQPDNNDIGKLNIKAEELYNRNLFTESIKISEKSYLLAKKKKSVKDELKALILLADNYYQIDNNRKALGYYKTALNLANKLSMKKEQAESYKGMGNCSKFLGKYADSLNYFKLSLQRYEEMDSLREIADITFQIAGIYRNKGNFEKALGLYHKVLNTFESLRDKDNSGYIIQTLHTIGEILQDQKRYSKAIEYYRRAKKISYNNKNDLYASSLILLSGVYEDLKNYEKAITNYKEAIRILLKEKDKSKLATAFNNLGEVYRKTKKYGLGMNYYSRALKIYRELDFQLGISASLANMGVIKFNLQNYVSAIEDLFEAKDIAEKQNIPKLKKFIYKSISQVYEKSNNSDKALQYYKKYIEVNNEILNEDRIKKFAEMQTKYETVKKDKEIEISRLKFNKQNLISKIFIVGFIIVLFFVFLVYSRYRLKKKANTKLSLINTDLNIAKKQIELKNIHITDSIIYAKRIQNAILPTEPEMKNSLKKYFILYMPKDIVSGDFYWLYEDENKLIVSVIDCTGHGVPGALMSILGNSVLNEIVKTKSVIYPDQILNELDKGVIRALKKEKEQMNVRDGMDVALFYFDKTGNKAYYSGARRPLFILKKSTGNLLEIKGVRLSIGEIRKRGNKKFQREEIFLEIGDIIYLTSDGYIDQSNSSGERLGSKRFKNLLKSFAEIEIEKQKDILLNELIKHQKEEEQIDDISILGLSVFT